MVQVKAAKKILIGLARARVLRDRQPRDHFGDFAGAQQRPVRKGAERHAAFRGGSARAHAQFTLAPDKHSVICTDRHIQPRVMGDIGFSQRCMRQECAGEQQS